MKDWLVKATQFVKKYERHLSSIALIFGFTLDNLTFSGFDLGYSHLVVIAYIALAGLAIILLNFLEIKQVKRTAWLRVKTFLPLVIQFAFGGLFSAFFVFYSRSGTFWSSWPFLLLILALLIINEFLKEKYSRLIYQVGIYYFIIFSYSIFLVPLIIKDISWKAFLISGATSILIILLFMYFLHFCLGKFYYVFNKLLWSLILIIYLILNLLYFTNIIPPIPLAMNDSGPYHLVVRKGEQYELQGQQTNLWQKFWGQEIDIKKGQPVFFYSAVFAPTKINSEIFHEWQHYNETKGDWESLTKVSFRIYGGRDGGYRGYSLKQNLTEGKWRVQTKTSQGQIIGQDQFKVNFVDDTPILITEIK